MEENFICNDIVKFIKKFINTHKENINIDSLNQYLRTKKDNFSNLMAKILDVIGPFNDTILDDLKKLFEAFLDNKDDNQSLDRSKEESESEMSGEEKEILYEKEFTIKHEELNSEEVRLINGDEIIEEKIANKKKKQKVKSINNNLLDELVYNEN